MGISCVMVPESPLGFEVPDDSFKASVQPLEVGRPARCLGRVRQYLIARRSTRTGPAAAPHGLHTIAFRPPGSQIQQLRGYYHRRRGQDPTFVFVNHISKAVWQGGVKKTPMGLGIGNPSTVRIRGLDSRFICCSFGITIDGYRQTTPHLTGDKNVRRI
jgi:hypothetical protein